MTGRPALAHQAADDLPQLAARQGIDAGRGLVEQQQLRRADQRAGQAQLLLHAARELAGQAAHERRQRRHLHQLGILGRDARPRRPRAGRRRGRGSPGRSGPRRGRSAAACSRCGPGSPADRRRRRCRARSERRRPAASRPAISRISVVLPAPSEPTRAVTAPAAALKLTSVKRLERLVAHLEPLAEIRAGDDGRRIGLVAHPPAPRA